MTSSKEQRRSKLEEAKGSQERYQIEVDLSEVLLLDEAKRPLGKAVVRIPTRYEEQMAILAANDRVANLVKRAGGESGAASNDPDLLLSCKEEEIVHRAFRDPDDPTFALFHSPSWMAEHLTTHEIGALLRILEEVKKARGGQPWEFTPELAASIRDKCVAYADTPAPEVALANLDPIYLTSFVVYAMCAWHDERKEHLAADDEDGHSFTDDQVRVAAESVVSRSEPPPES